MASCVKCGKHRLRKDKEGRFRCRICGPRQQRVMVCEPVEEKPDEL